MNAWSELRLSTPGSASARGWSHSGIVTHGDDLLTTDPRSSVVLRLTPSGQIREDLKLDVVQAHGLTLSADERSLWVADTATVNVEATPGHYVETAASDPPIGVVIQVDLDGHELVRFGAPPVLAYDNGAFRPTSVAVDDVIDGGSGDVWVADGYGCDLVHRFSTTRGYVNSLELPRHMGVWDTPHGLHIDRREAHPRLLVADRGNRRVCVFDLDGHFMREIRHDGLHQPSAMATSDNLLFVADLTGRISVFDHDDLFVTHLGSAPRDAYQRPGWPNRLDEAGRQVEPEFEPGILNSPHDVTFTSGGQVAVCEWVLGGRVSLLDPPR